MLQITIPERELWDSKKQEFIYTKACTLTLEHSLVSISKWEAKYNKPFLSTKNKTKEETLYYIQCMTITQNVPSEVYYRLTADSLKQIYDYMNAKMTATTFSGDSDPNKKKGKNEIITSEIIYYWMITLNIPIEFQKWHLNRLLTLIRVFNAKRQKPKKMKKSDVYNRNASLNAARRKALGSSG